MAPAGALRIRHRDERRIDAVEQHGEREGSLCGPRIPRARPRPSTNAGALSTSANTPSSSGGGAAGGQRIDPFAAAARHGAMTVDRR